MHTAPGISLSAVPSQEQTNASRVQASPNGSASVKSADARLGENPHELAIPSPSHPHGAHGPHGHDSHGRSLSIVERIRLRDFQSAAVKVGPSLCVCVCVWEGVGSGGVVGGWV